MEAPLGEGGGVVVCGEGVEEGGEGKRVCCGGWEEEESGVLSVGWGRKEDKGW